MTNCYFVFSWLHMDLVKLERLHKNLRKRHKDEASEDSSGSHAWWKSLPGFLPQCHWTWDVQRGCILSRLVSSNKLVHLCFSGLCCKWQLEQLGSLFSNLWRRTQAKEKGGGTGVKYYDWYITCHCNIQNTTLFLNKQWIWRFWWSHSTTEASVPPTSQKPSTATMKTAQKVRATKDCLFLWISSSFR